MGALDAAGKEGSGVPLLGTTTMDFSFGRACTRDAILGPLTRAGEAVVGSCLPLLVSQFAG
jgi:hypothetical protein